MKKIIDVISTSRADFSLILPICVELNKSSQLLARLILTGTHEEHLYHENVDNAISNGFARENIIMLRCEGLGVGLKESGAALGEMTTLISELWSSVTPAATILLGDRFELLPAASLAVLNKIPICHMFGGEVDVSYCIDTQVRDAITKMAHLHFVSHEIMKQRLIEMGEEAWRIKVVGNPALTNLGDGNVKFMEFARQNSVKCENLIAACYLPPTIQEGVHVEELDALLASLALYIDHTFLWAGVNADPGATYVREKIKKFCENNRNHIFVENLGRERFYGLLKTAKLLIGNSSSGLLEAASFGLPVVNIGVRQTGRLYGQNVIDVPADQKSISEAINKALNDITFKTMQYGLKNPFKVDRSSSLIADHLLEFLSLKRDHVMIKRARVIKIEDPLGLKRVSEKVSRQ